MALLEDLNCCALCDKPVVGYTGGVPRYYCNDCFETYNEDILANALWVVMMLRLEKARRKRRNRVIGHNALPKFVPLEPAPLALGA